ncbi:hypothetical protein BH11PLA1_BH11PLA1_11660 [soil metagenome]
MPQTINRTFKLDGIQCFITVFFVSEVPLCYRFSVERWDEKTKTPKSILDTIETFVNAHLGNANSAVDAVIEHEFEEIERKLSRHHRAEVTESRTSKTTYTQPWP